MTKPGRPRKNGIQDAWTLLRAVIALSCYHEVRAGNKHAAAVGEAVSAMRCNLPGFPISQTEVKRALAQLQPEGFLSVVLVSKASEAPLPIPQLPPAMCQKFGLPTNSKMMQCFTIGLGSRPEYARHNSKNSNQDRSLLKK
jgi:hypothetical protein